MHEMNEGAREAFVDGFDDPAVLASWRAMNDLVDRLTPGEVVSVSNYADERLVATFMSLARRGELTVPIVEELLLAYSAFLDALAPFQPSPEFVAEAARRPSGPWDAPLQSPGDDKVFYFLPRSGGYWVSGKRAICEASEALKLAVVSLGDARPETHNDCACPV